MSFVSFSFAIFVASALLIYYLMPVKYRYLVLLVFSLLYYYITCGKYIVYILITIVVTYLSSMAMERVKQKVSLVYPDEEIKSDRKKKKEAKEWVKRRLKLIMIICLCINFGVLGVLKYSSFLIFNLAGFGLDVTRVLNSGFFGKIVLPLGISFYTFQSMGYIIDLFYRRYDAEKNPFKLALFVTFFPQIIQGPISRYKDLSPTLFNGNAFDPEKIKRGMYLILFGLAKKLIIADRLSSFVYNTADRYSEMNGTYLFLMIFFYSMQLYSDFSGGINITVGVAKLFGVDLVDNFRRPFFSKSVAEYWRRWHITLGTWFRDYIFYPISISKRLMELGRKISKVNDFLGKRTSLYTATIVVWAATGLWHGAERRYVLWGLLNGIIMCVSAEFEPLYEKINSKIGWRADGFAHKSFSIIRTFLIMSLLRIFDLSSRGIKQAFIIFKKIFTEAGPVSYEMLEELGLPRHELRVALIGIVVLFIISMLQRKKSIYDRLQGLHLAFRWAFCTVSVALILVYGFYGLGYDSAAFIYMQF